MRTKSQPQHQHPHPHTFEQAREAILTIKALRPTLSESELETLELLLDKDAMTIIERSVEEAANGKFESLENAVEK